MHPQNDWRDYLEHSAKGQKWKSHKYIAIENGRYIYPEDRKQYQNGFSLLKDVDTSKLKFKKRTVKKSTSSPSGLLQDYYGRKTNGSSLLKDVDTSKLKFKKRTVKKSTSSPSSLLQDYYGRKSNGSSLLKDTSRTNNTKNSSTKSKFKKHDYRKKSSVR